MPVHLTLLVDTPSRRAHGNVATRLALGLVETGEAEVTLLCYSDDAAPRWLPSEVRIERLGVERVSRCLPALTRYLCDHQPDALIARQVHANFVALAASGMARLGRRWQGKLVVVQDHPIELSHASNWRDNKWVAKLSYRFADGVISPSPGVRQDVIRWCGLPASSVAVVPNPIPRSSGRGLTPPHSWLALKEPPVFVTTSNMTPWKRLDVLIEAFATLRLKHEARLLLLGEGPGRAGAEAQIRRLGLTDEAQALGWVDDPLEFAAWAWAFVLSSDEEGFAQVLTEAMSVGCPVISTDSQGGGPRFVTEGGRCGVLVPRGDAAGLSGAMESMLIPDVRARYADLGLQRAGELSPVASARALLAFLSGHLGLAT